MDLTGVMSDVNMCEWDKQVIKGIEDQSMMAEMYKRYIDDENVVLDVSEETGSDDETVQKVKVVADSVDPSLPVSTDHTTNYEEGSSWKQ